MRSVVTQIITATFPARTSAGRKLIIHEITESESITLVHGNVVTTEKAKEYRLNTGESVNRDESGDFFLVMTGERLTLL